MSRELRPLLRLFDREVHVVEGAHPAVFYIVDREAGGILVNTPDFSQSLFDRLAAVARPAFAFFPTRHGACDVAAWRAAGVRALASEGEADFIAGGVDVPLGREHRLTRTIDFLPMSGRTRHATALRCRNKPGLLFLGDILEYDAQGAVALCAHEGDDSFENRLIGAVGLQDMDCEYVFCGNFTPGRSLFGPGALDGLRRQLSSELQQGGRE